MRSPTEVGPEADDYGLVQTHGQAAHDRPTGVAGHPASIAQRGSEDRQAGSIPLGSRSARGGETRTQAGERGRMAGLSFALTQPYPSR